jgi:hypothetical protein
MKNILLMLLFSKLGLLLLSLIFVLIFGITASITNYEWANIGLYISLIYPIGLAFLMIIYAWFINPIKQFYKNKKIKK